MDQLWVRKYSPKTIDDVLGNNKIIELSKVWLNKIKKNKHICNYLFYSGTSGVGKTITASLLLQDYGFDVHEYNSSNHEKISDFVLAFPAPSVKESASTYISQTPWLVGVKVAVYVVPLPENAVILPLVVAISSFTKSVVVSSLVKVRLILLALLCSPRVTSLVEIVMVGALPS